MGAQQALALDGQLQRVVERLPSMVSYWDTGLRCRFANQAYRAWFGAAAEQVVGMHLRELLGEPLFAQSEPHARAALHGQEQRFEYTLSASDGQVRQALACYLPDVQDGRVHGFIAHLEDAPQKDTRQQLHEALRRADAESIHRADVERRLREARQGLSIALASIEAGFILVDTTGRVSDMNETAQQITGWPLAEARGVSVWEVFAREGRPLEHMRRNPLEVARELGEDLTRSSRARLLARAGRRVTVEMRLALTRDAGGRPDGMVIVFRDLTQANLALQDAERLAAIVHFSQDAIIGETLEGMIVSWNEAAQKLFGYTAEEAIGMPVQRLVPPDRRDEEDLILAQLGQGTRIPALHTVRLARDGQRIDVSISLSPIRDREGSIVGGAKIVRDLSREKAAEQARLRAELLETQNLQLQEAMNAKSLFLANMSHELRTPLNAVIGFAQLLQARAVPAGSPKFEEFVEHIASSGRHLLNMINDLLDFSKAEAGKFQFVPSSFDMPSVLADLAATMEPTASLKRLSVTVQPDPAVGTVTLDESRFRQIVYNYLSNAIKFTPEGGRITLRTRWREAFFVVEVEDTGPGIGESDAEHLFSEFKQLRPTAGGAAQPGTGLGLALTRKLAEAQGGHAGVRSRPGHGSTFFAVLPVRHLGLPDTDTAAPAPRVLVAGSGPALQSELAKALEMAGAQVTLAASRSEALSIADAVPLAALALTLQGGSADGTCLLQSLRSRQARHMPPVIAVALSSPAGSTASFAVTDVLRKPAQLHELRTTLQRLQAPAGRGMKLLVADSDAAAREHLQGLLAQLGIESAAVADGRQVLAQLEALAPDALVLAPLLAHGMDGMSVLDMLRRRTEWRYLPVFLWTGFELSGEEHERLSACAAQVLDRGGGTLEQVIPVLQAWVAVRAANSS